MIIGTCFVFFMGLSAGSLDNKTIFLSPGHGFYRHPSFNWTTQRSPAGNLVEDLETSDTVFAFLIEYLRRSGADVWPLRCECPSKMEIIVDNKSKNYEEEGNWKTTSSTGFNGSARYALASTQGRKIARFNPVIPVSGRYPLYVWYVAGSNRSTRVMVRINYSGGTDEVLINQQKHGSKWRYIGTYYFFTGRSQTIEIRAASHEKGKVVVADAIRIGGGMGSVSSDGASLPSGRSRYEEASIYWLRYLGAPKSVYDSPGRSDRKNDVTCRPLYAEFERESDEDALYISYHTNGGGGSGTETYIYSNGATKGSRRLQRLVHEEIIHDLHVAWDKDWKDRGQKSADLGELRPLRTMPGMLIEAAFHDNAGDQIAERSPAWRKIISRAIYQGITRYFNGEDAVLLPEPPRKLTARWTGKSFVLLSWTAPLFGMNACGAGKADSYMIEISSNGLAYSVAGKTSQTRAVLKDIHVGKPVFYRIVAVNKAGRSFPSRTACIIIPKKGRVKKVLFVSAFSEDEGTLRVLEDINNSKQKVLRLKPGRTPGGGDTALEHVWALWSTGRNLSCDFTGICALEKFVLDKYDLVVVSFGEQKDELLPGQTAGQFLSYIKKGGRMIFSGANIPGALCKKKDPETKELLLQLGIVSSRSHQSPVSLVFNSEDIVSPKSGKEFKKEFKIGATTDWGYSGVMAFDGMKPLSNAKGFMRCCGDFCAISSRGRSVVFSFPLESVPAASIRAGLYEKAIKLLFDGNKIQQIYAEKGY